MTAAASGPVREACMLGATRGSASSAKAALVLLAAS